MKEYPQYQPYGGSFGAIVPHVTIGHRTPTTDLDAAAREVERELPLVASARFLTLLAQDPSTHQWGRVRRFELGQS